MTVIGVLFLSLLLSSDVGARDVDPKVKAGQKTGARSFVTDERPLVNYTAHNRGNIQLAIANNGTFGTLGNVIPDPFTGDPIPSCIYPKGSDIVYLWVAAVWIGAIVGRDTLVSCADEDWYRTREFLPYIEDLGQFEYRSIDINSPFYNEYAYSEEDILCRYTDTFTTPGLVERDPTDNRPHIPLNIEISQRSMAWSYSYADDFILFDYQIRNMGTRDLNDVYIGIYVDGDVWHTSRQGPQGWNDDIVGFYREYPFAECCDSPITVNIAYTADNDGDPDESGQWDYRSARGAVGVRVVRTPSTSLQYSYNWWIINYTDPSRDFGPRRKSTATDPYRDFGNRLGTPEGDRNKYYVLSHPEFDYDLIETAIDHADFLPAPENGYEYAKGWDTRYLLSFGPFDIAPGQKLPVSFAWIGGENLHVEPLADFESQFDPYHPDVFYNTLDFSKLARNSMWASWVYDNPGVDTDGDGFFGPVIECPVLGTETIDSIICMGDGVPDFRGAGPPPAPRLRVIPTDGKLIVRWNGYYSENTPDIFSQIIDFEGYRVYIARDERSTSYSRLTSYDLEDYNRYRFVEKQTGVFEWVLEETPFTVDSLRLLFEDPFFHPDYYTRENPYSFEDEVYYFAPQDYNYSVLTSSRGIHKVYPDQPRPDPDPAQWTPEQLTHEHGESLPKYYEYEYVIEDLLPTVPYYVAVTTFDFGSPVSGLPSLETPAPNNTISAYPQPTADSVLTYGLDVFVYPNPYRIDAGYRSLGFEGRSQPQRNLPDDKVRALHFANLPPRCTISIYSLDGDLINKIIHDKDPSDPQSGHDQWDLITRNTQAVVSGLYYYVVESENRTQVGKFVIIK